MVQILELWPERVRRRLSEHPACVALERALRSSGRLPGPEAGVNVMRPAILAVLCASFPIGCSPTDGSNADTVERDSAGIRVVENAAPEDTCAVASAPDLEIGVVEGPAEQRLHRIFDAATLSDGRIAVVNQGSDEIRIYDGDGAFDRAFGSRGGGPGEFNSVFQLWVGSGDTLIVADYRPWRFSTFTAAGEFVRSVVPDPPYVNTPAAAEPLPDGTFILARAAGPASGESPPAEGDWIRRTLHVVRHGRDGSVLDTLAGLPYGRLGWLDFEIRLLGRPVFEARSHVASDGMRLLIGRGEARELQVFDLAPRGGTQPAAPGPSPAGPGSPPAGLERPAALIRWPGGELAVEPEDVEAYRRGWLDRSADAEEPMMRRSGEAQASEDRPVADRFPAHTDVRTGLDGDIWVRMYPRPLEDDPGWLVFGPDGRLECRAFLPFENSWDLYEIGSDYVLGKMRGELDVERVRRFPLHRGGGEGEAEDRESGVRGEGP